MSQTVTATLANIRKLYDDSDGSAYEVGTRRMLAFLNSAVQDTLVGLGIGEHPQSALITLVAGTDEYTVTSSTPLLGLGAVVDDETDSPLTKVTFPEMLALRQISSSGRPDTYALYERTTDNALRLMVYPTPAAADAGKTFSVWTQENVADLTESSTLYLSGGLLRAIEKRVAAECVACLTDDALGRRKMNPVIVDRWTAAWQKGVADERARINRLHRQSAVTATRF